MKIRPAYTRDINEIVSMYKDLISGIYPNRELGSDYHFYKAIIRWIDSRYDIIVTEKNGLITGFYMAHVNDMSGLTQPVYYCAELYIKPNFRKSRAFYLMQKNIIKTAKHKNLILVADAVPSIKPIYKKLGAVATLTRYEKGS